jgi:hypothetical protein
VVEVVSGHLGGDGGRIYRSEVQIRRRGRGTWWWIVVLVNG